jgi:hypothetical protein
MLMSCHQHAWQNYDINAANRSFENVVVRMFGSDSKKHNLIQEEIKRRLHMGNACYH